jgi:hypothetical protein
VLVRTRGYSRGGSKAEGNSWLLIKHRDEWAGDLDIAEFAPKSVKTGFDFPEILAEDNPAVWQTNRSGGATNAMLRQIIEQAAELKASRHQAAAREPRAARSRKTARRKS